MEVSSPVITSGVITAAVAAIHTTTTHGPRRPKIRSRRSRITNPMGITSSVSSVEVASPPITTVANGGQISISRPVDNDSGHSPAMVVPLVMRTGRARSRTAARAAAPAVQAPDRTLACIRSTSRMAGFTVRPSSATAPTSAMMSAGVPVKTSAQVAPSSVSGTAISTRIGSVRLSNVIASVAKSSSSTGTSTRRNQDSARSSASVSTVVPEGRWTSRTASRIRSSRALRAGPVVGASSRRV
jgi:hypothetical protein